MPRPCNPSNPPALVLATTGLRAGDRPLRDVEMPHHHFGLQGGQWLKEIIPPRFGLSAWWPGGLSSLKRPLTGCVVYVLSYLLPSVSHLSRHGSVWGPGGAGGGYPCTQDPRLAMELLPGGPGLGRAHSPPDTVMPPSKCHRNSSQTALSPPLPCQQTPARAGDLPRPPHASCIDRGAWLPAQEAAVHGSLAGIAFSPQPDLAREALCPRISQRRE